MITLSPHPYVPPGAMMLALALLFGVTILNNNKLSKKNQAFILVDISAGPRTRF